MANVERHGSSWRALYVGSDGRRVREAVPARTKAEARELAAKLERRAWLQRRGLEVGPDELTGTLADLCSWWLEHRCPAATREGGGTGGLEKHVIHAAIGQTPLARLRTADLDELLHARAKADASPATLNKLRAILHTVFSKAKKAGRWVGENPVAAIESRKVPKRTYHTLTPEQLSQVLEQVPDEWRPLFACGPALGLRKGELFALRKADVDLVRSTITVARSQTATPPRAAIRRCSRCRPPCVRGSSANCAMRLVPALSCAERIAAAA